jgi:GNAT superfamily N-acetyltransferase
MSRDSIAVKNESSIRKARSDDVAELTSLCDELGYPSSEAEVSHRLGLLSRESGHLVLVAVDSSDRPVGWIHVGIVYRLESDSVAEIGGMVVAESWRGNGIGAALLAEAEMWALSAGFRILRVRSNVVRERAHQFYLRAGYARTKTAHVFLKSLG